MAVYYEAPKHKSKPLHEDYVKTKPATKWRAGFVLV